MNMNSCNLVSEYVGCYLLRHSNSHIKSVYNEYKMSVMYSLLHSKLSMTQLLTLKIVYPIISLT